MPVNLGVMLLAAGGSSRLGQPKQLLRINGEALVLRAARVLLSLQAAHFVVVTGSASRPVSDELKDLPVQIIHNPDWRSGMGSSIAFGVGQMPENIDGLLIFLCDQWRLEVTDMERIVEHWKSDISQIIVSSWRDGATFSYGPPALFPRKYFHELMLLQGDRGARSVIGKHKNNAHFLVLENAAFDIDLPADLGALNSGKS